MTEPTIEQAAANVADHVPSEAGYRRHRRNNEHCDACRAAHREYVRSRRQLKNGG